MKERPIIFNGEVIRAILQGRKTQTRRVIRKQPAGAWAAPGKTACPYGKPGDRLWVRETWTHTGDAVWTVREAMENDGEILYRATDPAPCAGCWWPSIFLPRMYSRILLEIVSVRVERVQDITDEDAAQEGVGKHGGWNADETECKINHRGPFSRIWDSINKKRGYGWVANPWVWVIEFKVEEVKK